jgi:hypothetical protein
MVIELELGSNAQLNKNKTKNFQAFACAGATRKKKPPNSPKLRELLGVDLSPQTLRPALARYRTCHTVTRLGALGTYSF